MQFTVRTVVCAGFLLAGACALAQGTSEAESPWLPSTEYRLMERSFSRCLEASYRARGIELSNDRIARAWRSDLDQYSGSLTVDDIRLAPQEAVAGLPFIQCAWFSAHGVVVGADDPPRR